MSEDSIVEQGMTLGERYRLDEEIGEGSFGKIFRAHQLNIERDVAIKILPPKFSSVDNMVERFRREARLASRLRHPNTITIHDYGRQEDLFFIAMEYLEGQDLADKLAADQRVSYDQALHIARQTLQSLGEAHKLGIIHRDLKPENIFLTHLGDDDQFVKVLDFGIAKLASQHPETAEKEGRSLTVQGNTVGTPAYMSPEQAAGEEVDATSDLYSLGIILFEMVNGIPPFSRERPVQTMRSHLFDPIPSFSNESLRNTGFETVVRKALAKEPSQRFQNAAEFLDALARPDLATPSLGFVSLGSPSTAENRPGSSQDSLPRASNQTPEPTPASRHSTQDEIQASDRNSPDDQVPFAAVPETQSSHGDPHPSGFSAAQGSVTSSIITVVEPPADEDVIVLTDKKSDAPPQSSSAAEPSSSPTSSSSPKNNKEWAWDDDLAATDSSGSQLLTDFDSPDHRRRTLAIALVITIGVIFLVVMTLGSFP